jgi:hypothetical protein
VQVSLGLAYGLLNRHQRLEPTSILSAFASIWRIRSRVRPKSCANFLQRVLAIIANSETHPDHFLFAR